MKQLIQLSKKPVGEWPDNVSIDDLGGPGWKSIPFSQFILKIHSRCNLACDYCYIYEMADTSWELQPPSMSVEVATQAARRIAQHVNAHNIKSISIVLHGGEPLLIGERRLREILEIFKETLSPVTSPVFGMQTNGLLLTDAMLSMLSEFNVGIGVSLDGDRAANDKHRKRRNGVGTYAVVADRLVALQKGPFSSLFTGILATIDVTNDPIEVYSALRAFQPPTIGFLLPHGNWTELPPAKEPGSTETPYADWLIKIFDYWFDSTADEPGIRMFDQIIRQIYGKPSQTESIGITPVSLATIETDGSFELVDTLKSAFQGAAQTGANVFSNNLDDLFQQPSIVARQIGRRALCSECANCEVGSVCGAGYYPHRYRQGEGFLNPSVFCSDLLKLILHIGARLDSYKAPVAGEV